MALLSHFVSQNKAPMGGRLNFEPQATGGFHLTFNNANINARHAHPSGQTTGNVQWFANSPVRSEVSHEHIQRNYPQVHDFLARAAHHIANAHEADNEFAAAPAAYSGQSLGKSEASNMNKSDDLEEISPNEVAETKKVGNLKGHTVYRLVTKGGYHVVAMRKGSKVEKLAIGPLRDVAMFLAQERYPDLEVTELHKGESYSQQDFEHLLPKYRALSDRFGKIE